MSFVDLGDALVAKNIVASIKLILKDEEKLNDYVVERFALIINQYITTFEITDNITEKDLENLLIYNHAERVIVVYQGCDLDSITLANIDKDGNVFSMEL